MSKEAEEPIDSQEQNTSEEVAETISLAEEAEAEALRETEEAETADAETVEETETVHEDAAAPLNEKILAIKSALHTQEEERQQEETKLQIADKVKKYKTAIENGEVPAEPPVTAEKTSAGSAPNPKKNIKKKSKKKKTKKKERFSLFPKKGDSVAEVLRKFVFLASSAIFVVCLCLIADYFWDNYQNKMLTGNLADIYEATEATDTTEETTEPLDEVYEYYGYLPNVETLLERNPDVVGWISIPNTIVNYPVLQRKGQEDGNEYYLKRNIDLEDAHAGSIFMDYRNDFDYVIDGKKQLANSANLIVYGHNMHDYSMFGSLKHYINNMYYYGEHPIVYLNSNYRRYTYKIFGFIVVDVDDETDTRFDYWNQLEFADEQEFYDYVNEIKRRTVRLTEVDVKYGDELLTLSTCNSTFSNGRLVVFARKLRDGEVIEEGTATSTENPNIKWPNSYYRWHKKTYDPDAEFVPYG